MLRKTTFTLSLLAIASSQLLAQSTTNAEANNDPADGWVKVFEGETGKQMMSRAKPIINGETMNFPNQDRATAIENGYKLAIAAMIKDPSLADRYGYLFREGYAGRVIQDNDQMYRYLAKADFSKWPSRYLPLMLGMSRQENRSQRPFSEAKRELALTLFTALKGTKDCSGLLQFIPDSELATPGPIRDAAEDAYCSESILDNEGLYYVAEYEVYMTPQGHHVTGKLPSILEIVGRDRVRPRFEAMLATAIQKPSNRIPGLFLSALVKLKAGEDPAVIEPILAEATDLLETFEKNRSYSNSFAAQPGFIRQVGQMLESADSLASRDRAVLACYRHILDAPKDMGTELAGSAFQYFFKLLEYGQTEAARQFARQSLPEFCRPKSTINGRPNPFPAIQNPEAFAQIFVDQNLPIDGHAMVQIPLGRPADVKWMSTLAFNMSVEQFETLADRARARVDSKAAEEYLMERVSSVLNSGESANNSQISTLAPELRLDDMTRISTPVSSAFAVRTLRSDPSQTAEATATAIDQAKEKIQAALKQQPASRPLAAVALALELTGDAAPSSTAVNQFISTMPKVDAFPADAEGTVPPSIAVSSTDALNLLAMVDDDSDGNLQPIRSYLKDVANRFGNDKLLTRVTNKTP